MSADHAHALEAGRGNVLPVHRDDEGSKTGMWLFLFTELLLFGGLFLIYAVYRSMDGAAFHHAAEELNRTLGVTNTVVLLTSSLTMVLSVSALQRGNRGRSLAMLTATFLLSCCFLVIKYFEWSAKYHHGIFPGTEHIHALPAGEGLFFSLYFMMTGLHGIHVVVGMIAMAIVFAKVRSGSINQDRHGALEYVGLYWHLVDLIWVFLLPLFYLTN
ncbi:MAG: cytochrome c oxidase subunit 3 [bacterium]